MDHVLSVDLLVLILSFVVPFKPLGRDLARAFRPLLYTCKALWGAAGSLLDLHVRDMTQGRWVRAPLVFKTVVLSDAVRLRIDGVTQGGLQRLMMPAAMLESMGFTIKKLGHQRKAHVYPVDRALEDLSIQFPCVDGYETALRNKEERRRQREARRAEQARRGGKIGALREALGSLWTPDNSVVHKYIRDGQDKHWAALQQGLDEARCKKARILEVRNLRAGVPRAVMDPYVGTGDASAWEAVVEWCAEANQREARMAHVHTVGCEMLGPSVPWASQIPVSYWRSSEPVRAYVQENTPCDLMVVLEPLVEAMRTKRKDYVMKLRKDELTQELNEHGLELRDDSKFCAEYIRGHTRACLEEVVGTMRLTNHLFETGGPRAWTLHRRVLERQMRQRVARGNMQWYEACDAVLEAFEPDSDDDSW